MNPIRPPLLHGLLALLLAGCTSVPPAPAPAPPSSPSTPELALAGSGAWYRQQTSAGQPVYRIDPASSLVTVLVRRGGTLARFGHDHVVASRSMHGYIAPDAGRADMVFRLDQMTVDEPALRQAAGLDTQPTPDAIEGTRRNMLTRVLDAGRFPLVQLHAERLPGSAPLLRLSVTLHGSTRSMEVPVQIERSGATLVTSGRLQLLQTDFGITPLSIMGGAISVQDRMAMEFRIVARVQR